MCQLFRSKQCVQYMNHVVLPAKNSAANNCNFLASSFISPGRYTYSFVCLAFPERVLTGNGGDSIPESIGSLIPPIKSMSDGLLISPTEAVSVSTLSSDSSYILSPSTNIFLRNCLYFHVACG